MHDSHVDYTSFFRALSQIKKSDSPAHIDLCQLFDRSNDIEQWFDDYLKRLGKESTSDETRGTSMKKVNPKYILRNHLAQKAIELAQNNDFSEVQKLLIILSKPYDEQPQFEEYASPPPSHLQAIEVSCSS
jgi:uncharacterized protein YdiU (UPF0061 family)